MTDPVIRPFRAATDFRAVLDCQCDLYEVNFPRFQCSQQFLQEQAGRLRQAARRPFEHAIFVMEDAGEVVGFVWVALRMDLTGVFGSVDQVYLKPAYRGRRLGERLMERAHDHLRDMGVEWVRLFVTRANGQAVRLYESMGYATVRLEMERRLD
jgi:ribosomal protein S18 acetylase RimI-like enzyme